MRIARPFGRLALIVLMLALALSACDLQPAARRRQPQAATASAPPIPAVDADYLYDQFATLSTRFIHREAGFDTELAAEPEWA